MPVPAVKSFLRRLSQIPVAVDEKINGLLFTEGGGDGLAAGPMSCTLAFLVFAVLRRSVAPTGITI